MARALYLRLYDRLLRRPGVPLVLVAAAGLAATVVASTLTLDMSFRPLFGQDAEDLASTDRFEAEFGQRSGAYIGAIVTPDRWTSAFFEALARASDDVARLPHVTEVVSLTRVLDVVWTDDSVSVAWVTPREDLDSLAEKDFYRLLAVSDDADLERTLVSRDRRRTLLMARLDLPIQDLRRRAGVIGAFQRVVDDRLRRVAHRRWVGLSVVEVAYSRLVLSGLATSLAVTTVALLAMLLMVYRRVGSVACIMAGVTVALPVALALMAVRGQAITIVNSMVPTMILIIGVADAIHMFECFAAHMYAGRGKATAVREMFGDMALPCLLTTLTTVAGFLALGTARIEAIRDFGVNVGVGIVAVYVANLLVLPALLTLLPAPRLLARGGPGSPLGAWRRVTSDLVCRRPVAVSLSSTAVIALCVLGVQRLDVDQRFNEDISPSHPVRASQEIYEREFTGFLGPDVSVRRTDGAPLLGTSDRERLAAFAATVERLPGVLHVRSVLDHVPDSVDSRLAAAGLATLRADPRTGARVAEVIDAEMRETVVAVHIADIGSRASLDLAERIRRAAARTLGEAYDVEVVGQWWLAQLGLANILRDMLVSFGTSFALVLPLLLVTLRSLRLLAVGLLPNLVPALFAMGFMGWTGISVRVGTAMILAIALAIAVDDTIHMLARLKRERSEDPDPRAHVRSAIEHTGSAIALTTVVLVAGFLGMSVSGLLAIRDMGIVAAATLTVALVADVYLLPASYVLLSGRGARTRRVGPRARRLGRAATRLSAAPTSPDV